MTAIITCGESRQSLAAVRALGRAQIPVAVGAIKRPSLAMWSRFASSTFLTADPKKADLFARHLGEELAARYANCALVSSDDAWWALSRYREFLPASMQRLLPPHYSVVRSLDHEALYYFAQSLGIACASLIRVVHTLDDDLSRQIKGLAYPLLVSPVAYLCEDGTRHAHSRIVVQSHEQLCALADLTARSGKSEFLISPFMNQPTLTYFGIADRGHIIVDGFQEGLSELLPYNEVTLAVTVNPIASLRRSSQLLLAALLWQGPFALEFARVSGGYRLVSLCGRLWSSLHLAICAGVNIPLICYRMAEGTLTKDLLHNARPHIRMRWLVGDVLAKISHPWLTLTKVKDWTTHLSAKNFWHAFMSREKVINRYDVVDVDDPMPFLFELQSNARKAGKKIKKI